MGDSAPRATIRLLGEAALSVGGAPVGMRTMRVAALVGYLVAHGPRTVSRGVLAASLWPDREAAQAHHNLRQTLLRLRQSLGGSADFVLETARHGVRLRPEAFESDVVVFRNLVGQGTDEAMRAAVDLYGGPFLAGVDDDWVLPVRADLARSFVNALVDLSTRLAASDPPEALRLAERAVAEEPYREGARACVIRALRAMGEEALALRAFEAYESLLDDELGLRPTRMVEAALNGEIVGAQEARPEPVPVELGTALRTLAEGGRTEEALRLAVSMAPYWIEIGQFRAGLEWLDQARREYDGPDAALAGQATLAVATLALRAGALARTLREAETLLGPSTDGETRVRALTTMARAHLRRRETTGARQRAIQALRVARRLPSGAGTVSKAWFVVAAAHENDGAAAPARAAARRAKATAGASAQDFAFAGFLVASSSYHLGAVEEAREALEEVLRRIDGDRGTVGASVRANAARLFEGFGDVSRAEAGYVRAVEELRRTGDPWMLPIALTYLGDLRTAQDHPSVALPLHEEALAIRRQTEDRVGAATSRRGVGLAYLRLGRIAEARDALREAVRLFSEVDLPSGIASSLVPLARAEAAIGTQAVAVRLVSRAIRLLRDMSPAVRANIGPQSESLLPEAEALLDLLEG